MNFLIYFLVCLKNCNIFIKTAKKLLVVNTEFYQLPFSITLLQELLIQYT
jgi:hypothetical protein